MRGKLILVVAILIPIIAGTSVLAATSTQQVRLQADMSKAITIYSSTSGQLVGTGYGASSSDIWIPVGADDVIHVINDNYTYMIVTVKAAIANPSVTMGLAPAYSTNWISQATVSVTSTDLIVVPLTVSPRDIRTSGNTIYVHIHVGGGAVRISKIQLAPPIVVNNNSGNSEDNLSNNVSIKPGGDGRKWLYALGGAALVAALFSLVAVARRGRLWCLGFMVLMLVLAGALVPLVSMAAVSVPAPKPSLPVMRIINSLTAWNDVVSNVVATNISAKANYLVTVSNNIVKINATGWDVKFVLNSLFSYDVAVINGSVKVGFMSNGTEVVSYTLGPNSDALLHSLAVYTNRHKILPVNFSVSYQPFIEVNNTVVYLKMAVEYMEVRLSAPAPPFQGQSFSGTVPLGGDGNIWNRTFGAGRYRVAFWEGHNGYDVDLWMRNVSSSQLRYALMADNAEWNSVTVTFDEDWLAIVHRYYANSRGSWMMIIAALSGPTSTSSDTVTSSTTTSTVSTTSATTSHPRFDLNSIRHGKTVLAAIAGVVIVIALISVMAAAGRGRGRRGLIGLSILVFLLIIAIIIGGLVALFRPDLAKFAIGGLMALAFIMLLFHGPNILPKRHE